MLLPTTNVHTAHITKRHSFNSPHLRQAKKGTWLVLLAIFAFTLYHLSVEKAPTRQIELGPLQTRQRASSITSAKRNLVVVLPANGPSTNLCKVVASAVASGYPAPVVVNWRKDDTEAQDQVRSHLSKITGVRDFLSWATSENVTDGDRLADDDLVLMLDAYDVWLQLPPSILIERYLAANERANERIALETGHSNIGITPLQTILASSQKRCYAPRNKLSDLHCDAVPDSELSDDVFGFFTDSMFSGYQSRRPRYLNSGSFLGPAGDMLRYFQRVGDRMEQHLAKSPSPDELSGDQGIFAEILGEQELWRRETFKSNSTLASREQLSAAQEFEYHVGLDYTQELFYPTCYSEQSGSFVRLQDSESVLKESTRAGVTTPRVEGLPSDISKARPPLHKISNSTSAEQQTWDTMPLYVDYWTTSIPVAVHHNAWRDGLKSRQQLWWDKTWYFPYLRELIEVHMASNMTVDRPVARLRTSTDTNRTLTIGPYPATETPRAAYLFGDAQENAQALRGASWNLICEDREPAESSAPRWYDEVFRDGRGSV